MKRWTVLLLTVLIISLLIPVNVTAASGSLSVSADSKSITVGNTVKVTITYNGGDNQIASIWSNISYNASAFNYVESNYSGTDGTSTSGGSGVVKAIFEMPASGVLPKSVSMNLVFKATAPGDLNLSVGTLEFTANDNAYSSLGNPTGSVSVSATNPTLSANANLASIKPSAGTLTPKFSAGVTNYTITVPYTTTSVSLSATTQDGGAKIAVSGKNALAVGKNTRIITVTAPSGATKKYTVVITRSANQATTTTTKPPENLPTTEIDGVEMAVSNVPADATLPEGFALTPITVNDVAITAAVNEKNQVTLTYLINPQTEEGALYVYNATNSTYEPYNPLAVSGGSFVLLNMPTEQIAPARAVKDVYTFGTAAVAVYRFEDTALADIVLVYAISPAGKSGLYVYDTTDGSMQLYREMTVPVEAEPEPEPVNPFVAFVTQYRQVILICAAALGGVALLIGATVLLLITLRKDKNCKH